MSLDRLEAAWKERLGSTEIDSRLKPRLVVSVRSLKHLHSSPDLDSLLFLSDLTGKNIDSLRQPSCDSRSSMATADESVTQHPRLWGHPSAPRRHQTIARQYESDSCAQTPG